MDSPRILFASNNKDKWLELYDGFKNIGIDLIYAPEDKDIGRLTLVENCDTLEANSLEKAKQAYEQTGIVSLGDDSGLFVEALDGAPGVHSRRWFADEKDDAARSLKILELLEGKTNRGATMSTAFTLYGKDGMIAQCMVNNYFRVADNLRGNHGFGYDTILEYTQTNYIFSSKNEETGYRKGKRIFNDPTYFKAIDHALLWELQFKKKMTVGEMTQEQKNYLNDRAGKLIMKMYDNLKDFVINYEQY